MIAIVNLKNSIFFSIFFAFTSILSAQSSSYAILRCIGNVPNDFNKTEKPNPETLITSQILTNKLLNSGLVIFGDSITQYINYVADKALAKEPELRNKLRFYTIKTSQSQIMSINKEVILVSIGLLTQIENEAQLAYLICRTAAETKSNRTIKYSLKSSKNIDCRELLAWDIRNFSKIKISYPLKDMLKDDEAGLNIFKTTEYIHNESFKTMDILTNDISLMKLINWKPNQFEDEYFKIPNGLLLDSIDVIKAKEKKKKTRLEASDDDDGDNGESEEQNAENEVDYLQDNVNYYFERSDNLKLLLENETKSNESKGELGFSQKFERIKKIAQFEMLYCLVIESEYEKSYYNAMALESIYGEIAFLDEIKLLSIYNLGMHRFKAKVDYISSNNLIYSEELKQVGHFFTNANGPELMILTVREGFKASKKFPDNDVIKYLYKSAMTNLFKLCGFNKGDFSSKNQVEMRLKIENDRDSNSKYKKILSKSKIQKNNAYTRNAFALMMEDVAFKSVFMENVKLYNKDKRDDDTAIVSDMNLGIKKWINTNKKINLSWTADKTGVLIYQNTAEINESKKIKAQNIKRTEEFCNALEKAGARQKLKVTLLNKPLENTSDIEKWNNNNQLKCWLMERANNDTANVFLINKDLITGLADLMGTDIIAISNIKYEKAEREFVEGSPDYLVFNLSLLFTKEYITTHEMILYNFRTNNFEKILIFENKGKPNFYKQISWAYQSLAHIKYITK